MMGGFARVVLVLYFAAYPVWAGPLLSKVWAEGGHLTPEHWAYHDLLESLGITHHHGSADRSLPVAEQAPGDAGVRVMPPMGSIIVSMPSTFEAPFDGTFHQILGAVGLVEWGDVSHHGVSTESVSLSGIRPNPPEKPPPIVR